MLLAGARVSFHFIIVLLTTLLVGFSGLAHASTPQQTAPAATQQKPEQPSAGQPDTDKPSTDKPSTGKPENKITPEQAEQLFRDVDTILNFASKDTTLPIKHEVKRRMASREEVVSYLKKNMAEDKDVQRLRRTELVLKKFGLLPKDFDLQTFLVSLLEEQVAGYYDAKTKTVNLLDWVLPDLQRPVLAHELTHALQDQSFGLDKWLRHGAEDLDTKKDLVAEDITKDENSEAREAVAEGQAERALRLAAAADRLREEAAISPNSPFQRDVLERLRPARELLNAQGLRAADEAPLARDEAIAYALGEVTD